MRRGFSLLTGSAGLLAFLRRNLDDVRGGRGVGMAPRCFGAWLAIVMAQTLGRGGKARSAEALQLSHDEFVEALARDGITVGLRTVQACAARAAALGLVYIDPDFDDCRAAPRRLRGGLVHKWPRSPNLYRPAPELLKLWRRFDWIRVRSSRNRNLRSKRFTSNSSSYLPSAVDRKPCARMDAGAEHIRKSVPPGGGDHPRTSTATAPPGRQLDAPPERQLVRGWGSTGGDGGETPRQDAPAGPGDVFRDGVVRSCLRRLYALLGDA
jgi:hypothetical protein